MPFDTAAEDDSACCSSCTELVVGEEDTRSKQMRACTKSELGDPLEGVGEEETGSRVAWHSLRSVLRLDTA